MDDPKYPSLLILAPAKINLVLGVGPPMPPRGYHLIASWFVATDLADQVRLTRLPDGHASEYHITWASDAPKPTPIDWAIEKDLSVRAHRLLEQLAGRALPLRAHVSKRIPVGGGLGGGSGDAAAALVGIDRLFDLRLGADRLRELSGALGSDVAFFIDDPRESGGVIDLDPRPALVTGFGERIERLRRPPWQASALLIFPPFGCPTAGVYAAFDRRPPAPLRADDVRAIIERAYAARAVDPRALFNDLALPACDAEPRLRELLDRLGALEPDHGPVHVTGSGSTLFMILTHDQRQAADALRDRIGRIAPEARSILVTLR